MLFPKPEKRKTAKTRERREESEIIKVERAKCVQRDGYCRLQGADGFGACNGNSEWAHLGDFKRWKTRGMAPEERHRADKSLMMCDHHHNMYDLHKMDIEELTPEGADGWLRFKMGTKVWSESGGC